VIRDRDRRVAILMNRGVDDQANVVSVRRAIRERLRDASLHESERVW